MDYYTNESLTPDEERLERFAAELELEGDVAGAEAVRRAARSLGLETESGSGEAGTSPDAQP